MDQMLKYMTQSIFRTHVHQIRVNMEEPAFHWIKKQATNVHVLIAITQLQFMEPIAKL